MKYYILMKHYTYADNDCCSHAISSPMKICEEKNLADKICEEKNKDCHISYDIDFEIIEVEEHIE